MTKLPEYHQSSLGLFLKCPRQYMYRYLMGMVIPPKAALTLGSSVDKALTANFQQKVQSKKDLTESDVLDLFSTDFDKRTPETDWDGESPGDQKDLGARMLKVFHQEASPSIQPKTVQESFCIETDAGYSVGGMLDLTDSDDLIRDFKTSKSSYSVDAVNDSIQATMYDFAFEVKHGKKPSGFAFDVITKHKTPKYQHVRGIVTNNQRERLFESIKIMHSQIQRGEFQYAAEGSWWCSKDWCGYWSLCKGKKNGQRT